MIQRSAQRSLTLLETLIALVLVVAMGALIFPSLMNTLDERAFESVAEETNEQLMRARAHAQVTGSPVEVTYDAHKSQVRARLFQPLENFAAPDEDDPDMEAPAASASRPSPQSREGAAITEAWALVNLGRSMRIVSRPPMEKAENALLPPAESLAPDEYETLEDLAKGQRIRLAVFMPDGTALMGDQVWLNDDKGRIGVFTINPWSGLPFFKRLADLSAKAAGDQRSSSPSKSDSRPEQ
jgi:type II secretory pathway pseudopilin PulG